LRIIEKYKLFVAMAQDIFMQVFGRIIRQVQLFNISVVMRDFSAG